MMNPAPANSTTSAALAGQGAAPGYTGADPPAYDHSQHDTLLGAGAGTATDDKHESTDALPRTHEPRPARTSSAGTTHPSMLNKIEGTVKAAVGYMMYSPIMVASGQAKKAGGPAVPHSKGAGGGAYAPDVPL